MPTTISSIFQKQFFRYVLSGGISFLVENISFLIFFYVCSVEIKMANVMSIGVALIVNFIISKYFVFRGEPGRFSSAKQFGLYGVLVACNILISTIAIGVLHDGGVPPFIAKPLLTVCVALWTYLIYKKIIFSSAPQKS